MNPGVRKINSGPKTKGTFGLAAFESLLSLSEKDHP